MKLDIITHGSDARLSPCRDILLGRVADLPSQLFSVLHLLPIPSTKDGLHVRTTDTPLASLVAEGTMLVGYGLPEDLTAAAEGCACTVFDAARDEAFILENARLTAVGALGYLLTHCPKAPTELSIGIIGYGRIGQELCRLLLFLGAQVRIYTGRSSVRHALGALGIETRPTEDAKAEPLSFAGLDALVNTAPAPGLLRTACEGLPSLLLELASGNNIEEGVAYTPLPSLPAVMYPYSAAAAYARAVLRSMQGSS